MKAKTSASASSLSVASFGTLGRSRAADFFLWSARAGAGRPRVCARRANAQDALMIGKTSRAVAMKYARPITLRTANTAKDTFSMVMPSFGISNSTPVELTARLSQRCRQLRIDSVGLHHGSDNGVREDLVERWFAMIPIHRWTPHESAGVGARRSERSLEWSARPARHCPIPVRPRNAGCDNGPLMVGACAGAESGAGIRFSNGACGVGGAKRVVGSLAPMWRPAPRA